MTSERKQIATLQAIFLTVFLIFSAIPAFSQARPSLSEDQHITDSLVSAAVGEGIRRGCPTIHARKIVAYRKAQALARYAMSLGYSKDEIKAFIKSPMEKERIIAAAKAYLAENGVVEGDKETYCRLGRAEISAGTLTGQLLWSWK